MPFLNSKRDRDTEDAVYDNAIAEQMFQNKVQPRGHHFGKYQATCDTINRELFSVKKANEKRIYLNPNMLQKYIILFWQKYLAKKSE